MLFTQCYKSSMDKSNVYMLHFFSFFTYRGPFAHARCDDAGLTEVLARV
jgi:hypothetical protein